MSTATIDKVFYTCRSIQNKKIVEKSIEVIGLDTEAYDSGQMFMLALSTGQVYRREEVPACFFTRNNRQKNYVAYNLSYDEGAILQFLTKENLRTLWEKLKVEQDGFIIRSIPKKCLSISKGKNSIHIYDMYNFYQGSLNYNAEKYLNDKKIDVETKTFSEEYVNENWQKLAEYCIHDAELVQRLAELLIKKFEDFGIYPRKLYSTAYMSYQYFSKKCDYPVVRRFWDDHRGVLDFAMQAYNGGKFEVTERGSGYFYEYDIVSAYPAEIANLLDITNARVVFSKRYRKEASFGFLKCRIKIPVNVFSPVAVKYGTVNTYPVGYYEKVITKPEYEFLLRYNSDIEIIEAYWLHCDEKIYPFREEINRLTEMKKKFKQEDKKLDYHTVKIFMNSLYGKFCQLIESNGSFKASSCWNPIYASYITARTRIKVSEYQNKFKDIIAVHTDSLISKKPLNIEIGKNLGDMDFETEGNGVIVGSGIYQIGKKNKYRGFNLKLDIMEVIDVPKKTITLDEIHAHSWLEVAFRNWETNEINHFEKTEKTLSVNFDSKRLWINDVKTFRKLLSCTVQSVPMDAEFILL